MQSPRIVSLKALLCFSLLLTTRLLQGQGVSQLTASLQLSPDTTLPGTPVAFLITITNPTDQVQKIGNGMRLDVVTASSTFEAKGLLSRLSVSLPTPQMESLGHGFYELTVPAHGQRTIYVDIGAHLIDNEFFADHRLSLPGMYVLQVALISYVPGSQSVATLKTNTATLKILTPSGVDADVWAYLQNQAGGTGWGVNEWITAGDTVAPYLRTNFASSKYVPWVAAMGGWDTLKAGLATLDAALAADPPPALRDDLLWTKGRALSQVSYDALFSKRDVDKAVAYADQARATYTVLRDNAISEYLRGIATAELSHLYTRRTAEDGLHVLAESDPPAPGHVVPRVECVTKGQGQSFSARFGYRNPNAAIKVIGIGNLNQVTPADRDQGQPRVFKPGDHANVFAAVSPAGNLTWHLDGDKAVATADFPVQCSVPSP